MSKPGRIRAAEIRQKTMTNRYLHQKGYHPITEQIEDCNGSLREYGEEDHGLKYYLTPMVTDHGWYRIYYTNGDSEGAIFVPIKRWNNERSLSESLMVYDAESGSDWTGYLSGAERITVTTFQINGG